MPLRNSQWNAIADTPVGRPKLATPLARRLGSRSALHNLVDAGHLQWISANKVTRTAASDDSFALFEVIPADGLTMSNQAARRASGLSEPRYRAAKTLLLRTGEIARARGRGGSVRRVTDVDPGARAGAVSTEAEMYQPFRAWLDEYSVGDLGRSFWLAKVIGHGGGMRKGKGQWSRPDVATIAVTSHDLLPDVTVEVSSYELKPYSQAKRLEGVFEASSHHRRVHYSSLVIEWPLDGDLAVPPAMQEECGRLGVGLFLQWAGDVEQVLEPARQDPHPAEVNDFLDGVLSTATDRDAYLRAIGRGSDVPQDFDVHQDEDAVDAD